MADGGDVVDFDATGDVGFADGGAVNATLRLNLDVVFHADDAGLQDFMPVAFVVLGEAEAVCSDDYAVLQGNVVAENAFFPNDGMGVGEEIVADADVGVDDDVGEQGGVVADDDSRADDDVGSDVGIAADLCGGVDDGRGVDSGSVGGEFVEDLNGLGESEVGIAGPQGGGGDVRKVVLDQYRGSLGGTGVGGVFQVGDKGDLMGTGFFDSGDARDFEVSVATTLGLKDASKLFQLHAVNCTRRAVERCQAVRSLSKSDSC